MAREAWRARWTERVESAASRGRGARGGLALSVANLALLVGIALLLLEGPCARRTFAPVSGRERVAGEESHFVRGDANADDRVDLSDSVHTLNFLFLGGPPPECLAAADADDDGEVALTDAVRALNHLFLGAPPLPPPFPDAGLDPTPDLGCRDLALPPLPSAGDPGGPDRELTLDESLAWRRGRRFFATPARRDEGLGPLFNGDSCGACHLDPALGGAGGMDVDVVRFARVAGDGSIVQLAGGPAVSRHPIHAFVREECPPEANVIETRQTPTLFGLGLVDRLAEATILANADPDDADLDGVSGRARLVDGGRLGRFGHKSGVPSLRDFAADGLANELGLTVDPTLSSFAVAADEDGVADPEVDEATFVDLAFFLEHLAPPARRLPPDPVDLARVEDGERIFAEIGCTGCHVPALAGADGSVAAYSDFLLHDVADPARYNVPEDGVEPREFRTAPLWGFRATGPWLHDGSAETFPDAIRRGHFGEAEAARARFETLFFDDKLRLEEFVRSL